MTIGNALNFIQRGLEDSPLRKRLNLAASLSEIHRILADEGLIFSYHDFDEAFHKRLVKCQELEMAEELKEFKIWWDLLFQVLESDLRES